MFNKGQFLHGLDHIIFGICNSDDGTCKLYKLTRNELFIDDSRRWISARHSRNGFTFSGRKLLPDKFESAKNLLNECPADLLDMNLKSFYTTGNKNEDKLVIRICGPNLTKDITIDSYDVETDNLSPGLKAFRLRIEEILKHLSG